MRLKTLAKGVVVCSAIGTACYMVSNSTPRQRRHLKKTLSKGMRSIGSMCNDFSYLV